MTWGAPRPEARIEPDPAVLEVEALGFRHSGGFALDDVSFTLRAGEFAVLLGPNGAGKTTLFSLITRLYQSPRGRVQIDGADMRRRPSAGLARLGVVFQQPTLDLDLTVERNLLYSGALHGAPGPETRRRIERELGRFEMFARRHEKVRRLNGGHRRRVEIARALLHRPRLLLLDEPTVGLDPPTRKAIVEHVHRLCRDKRLAVLWATHLIDEVGDDDRVILLHEGRIRAQGRPRDVIRAAGASSLDEAFARLTASLEPQR